MRRRVLLCLVLCSVVGFARAEAAAPTSEAPASSLPAAPVTEARWIFFRDRGATSLGASSLGASGLGAEEALAIARELPPETWARRQIASGSALPTNADRPLCASYLAAVERLAKLRVASRWLNAVSVDATPDALREIERLPFVASIRPVAVARAEALGPTHAPDGTPLDVTLPRPDLESRSGSAATPQGPAPYGPSYGQLAEIKVPAVHALGYSANRVPFMMLDTGFRKDHHAFAHARLIAERDFVGHDGDTQDGPGDFEGQQRHGTGTWGTSGGYDPGHLVGPAYGASFYLAKTENIASETQVEEDYYVAALEWADSAGVRVTSASLSYTCFDDGACYGPSDYDGDTAVITRAVDEAAHRGILCVNANGNYGPGASSLGTPADAAVCKSVAANDPPETASPCRAIRLASKSRARASRLATVPSGHASCRAASLRVLPSRSHKTMRTRDCSGSRLNS